MELIIDKNIKTSAGLMVMFENRILLGHPTGHTWWNSYTIPKGMVEKGESFIDAAIRETYEEVGLLIDKKQIKSDASVIQYKSKIDVVYKQIVYYRVNLQELPIICDGFKIKQQYLQMEEIDWAGFVTVEDALDRIFFRQKEIIDKANFVPINYV